MSLILNIDTAVESGAVSLSLEGKQVNFRSNENPRGHASWIHKAIGEMMEEAGYSMQDLKAIAVSNGPGSYTGLRIGLSAAKGLCYALQLPLICLPTTLVMASEVVNQGGEQLIKTTGYLCPLIDARRMEAYYAVYDTMLNEISPPGAIILDAGSFSSMLEEHKMVFFGNGSHKLKNVLQHQNAAFADHIPQPAAGMPFLSYEHYKKKWFNDISLADPLYIKDFHFPKGK